MMDSVPWLESWRAEWRDADGVLVGWTWLDARDAEEARETALHSPRHAKSVQAGAVSLDVLRHDTPMRFEAGP